MKRYLTFRFVVTLDVARVMLALALVLAML